MSEESQEHDQEVMNEIKSRSVDKRRAKGEDNASPNALLCVICKKSVKGYGNNAEPIKKGICCDICNILVVQERMRQFISNKEKK